MASRLTVRMTVVAVVTMCAVASCSTDQSSDSTSPDDGPGAAAEVTVNNFTFTPGAVSIAVGESVRWTNQQSVRHTVTSSDDVWDGSLDGTGTFEFTFTAPGTYPYFCAIHPSMTGTVEVSG